MTDKFHNNGTQKENIREGGRRLCKAPEKTASADASENRRRGDKEEAEEGETQAQGLGDAQQEENDAQQEENGAPQLQAGNSTQKKKSGLEAGTSPN